MSDLSKALDLEKLRFMEAIGELNKIEDEQIRKLNAGSAARGGYQMGGRLVAAAKIRTDKLQALIDARIEIRKELVRSLPELGDDSALEALLVEIEKLLVAAANPSHKIGLADGAAQSAIRQRFDQNLSGLKARAKAKIEMLKREVALKMHTTDKHRSAVTVNAGGHVIVNVGDVYGNVQQVIGRLNGPGQADVASGLKQLAKAIEEAPIPEGERKELLEQLEFIADRAAAPVGERKLSVVKATFESLRSRLQDAGNVAQILQVAGPALAAYFGFTWPH